MSCITLLGVMMRILVKNSNAERVRERNVSIESSDPEGERRRRRCVCNCIPLVKCAYCSSLMSFPTVP